ncbi:hypothetical protein NPIL_584531 [Nephila pilipes]|uniref:EGF-like domain-containing protein n=1 Tax=Nephila pilipes TaxID=299642 RepID=A0A8X6QJ98_NEPPI|nr:hypothetical protein NPIL_584531 [Nephila pilipes]
MYCVGKGIILLLIVGGVFILGAAVPENDDELIAGASCKNNGECRNDGVCGTKKVCECKEGWTGAYCENIRGCDWLKCDTKISNCIFDQTTKNAKCQCKENNKVYMDNRCIASCWNDMECLNSGYCNVYKVCRCREGSSGDHCEIVDGCEDLKCDTKISNCSLNVEAEKGMCQCKDDKKLYVNNKCVSK